MFFLMDTVVLVVCLLGLAYLVVKMLRAERDQGDRVEVPAAPHRPLGLSDVLPLHGFLMLPGPVDRVVVDGHDAGASDGEGWFDVPPGPHTLVGQRGGETQTWTIDVLAHDPEAPHPPLDNLRPWPRPAIFFVKPTAPLVVDGRLCRTDGEFGGAVNLDPGEHKIETATHTVSCSLAPGARRVIDFTSGEPEFLDPTVGDLMVRTLLKRARRETLVSAAELATSPTPAEALRAAESAIDNLDTALAKKPPRRFADEDLAALDDAFAAWRAGGELTPYVESLRAHYIPDGQMAKQAAYFARYGARVVAQTREAPALLGTEAGRYLRYLAQDLVDTDDETLAIHGRSLAALLGKTA